jgi:hypothetical protein
MIKSKTLKIAAPAVIKLMPLSIDNCWNIFCFRSGRKYIEFAYCVVKDEGSYKIGYFEKSHIERDLIEVYISANNWGSGYIQSKKFNSSEIQFCYFQMLFKYSTMCNTFWNIDAMSSYLDVIGTKKKVYFDVVQRQGTDFTYEQPYIQLYHQPNLKNRKLELRKKYSDVLWLDIEVDELDNELFVAIQKMAIDKFGVISRTLHSEGAVPCEVVEEIPVKLYHAKLNFNNKIRFQIEKSYLRKTPYILMRAGSRFNDSLLNFHMNTIHKKAYSVDEAEKYLKEFAEYSRIVPKLNSPWLFH